MYMRKRAEQDPAFTYLVPPALVSLGLPPSRSLEEGILNGPFYVGHLECLFIMTNVV